MKYTTHTVPALLAALLITLGSTTAMAAEVVAEAADTTAGGGLGASAGLMLGGAAGGPLGAVLGAGAGWLLGKTAQQVGGLHERAYAVRDDDGEMRVVRSPNAVFGIGEQVEHRGNRLYARQR